MQIQACLKKRHQKETDVDNLSSKREQEAMYDRELLHYLVRARNRLEHLQWTETCVYHSPPCAYHLYDVLNDVIEKLETMEDVCKGELG